MRNLKFNLDVQTNALLCPNPSEWFAKSYIQPNIADNFRPIPGVKESTKVAKTVFSGLLKAAGCSWAPVDTVLDAEDVDVCPIDVMVQLCQYDLESSFVAAKMAAGETNWTEAEMLQHFWAELSEAVSEEVQIVRWNGKLINASDVCTGYLKRLETATEAFEFTGITTPTFTAANIITALTGTIAGLSEAVKGNQKDVRIYMSASNAFLYQIATLGLNTNFNYTGELGLSFAGYPIAVQAGMSNGYIVAGNKNSFAYAFDGEGDEKALKIVNMMDTAAEPVLRARVGMKMGFHILNDGAEVAFAQPGN